MVDRDYYTTKCEINYKNISHIYIYKYLGIQWTRTSLQLFSAVVHPASGASPLYYVIEKRGFTKK